MAKPARRGSSKGKESSVVLRAEPVAVRADTDHCALDDRPAPVPDNTPADSVATADRGAGCSLSVEPVPARKKTAPVPKHRREAMRGAVAALVAEGLPQEVIARKVGVSSRTIRSWNLETLKRFPIISSVPAYVEDRTDSVQAMELKALESINVTLDSPSVTLKEATLAFKVLHSAGRLERNLSNLNVNNQISFTESKQGNSDDES